ncbi:mannan endo-1,4-beta-mannosidase-like [Haliotis cracherodii]|uniref:mannan endo-1,4-beta-mannosidase-like n=1 Tax=Haliotis cracherodii TaxID=6455 RepID=UPI0039EB295E
MSRYVFFVFVLLPIVLSQPNDHKATPETVALYNRLKELAANPDTIMFGQSSSTWMGAAGGHAPYDVTTNTSNRGWSFTVDQALENYPDELSDVKGVTGQYPAIFDLGMWQLTPNRSITLSYLLKKAHSRGIITTLCQHLYNPVTGGSPWVDKDPGNVTHTVRRLLPGGDTNRKYRDNLDKIAELVLNLKDEEGKLIPVLFRPLHELNGDWFWWGYGNRAKNTLEDLKSFYRYIVTYLRDVKNVHNILYVISPDKFPNKNDYLQFYPGDEYVDIMGTDFYYKSSNDTTADFHRIITDLVEMAESRNKIPTLSECGMFNNGISTHMNFWNDNILDVIKASLTTRRIAYILTWANECTANICQLWTPYKGHPAENDFRNNFFNDPLTIFAGDTN